MTILEREAKKAELARSILSIDSEEILNEISKFVENLTVKMPCMYSPEEIQAGADRVLAARRSGDKSRFVSFDEVKKRHV